MARYVRRPGERFGRLVLVRPTGTPRAHTRWLCQCDCGNYVERWNCNLFHADIDHSCGCAWPEIGRKRARRSHPTYGRVLSYYKRNAKLGNKAWEITNEAFTALLESPCAYCGASADLRSSGLSHNGIDRINNTGDYALGNVVSACTDCNRAKLSRTVAQFSSWLDRLVLQRKLATWPTST